MINEDILILQNTMGFSQAGPDSYSETCLTSSRDGSQFVSIKVEEVTDMQEEEDPLLITFPVTKAELWVSCKCGCYLAHLPSIQNWVLTCSLLLVVCPVLEVHSHEWILKPVEALLHIAFAILFSFSIENDLHLCTLAEKSVMCSMANVRSSKHG
jgi:hypothetical protein